MSYPYPPHGSQLPREFRMASDRFGRMLVPFVPELIVLFLIALALGSILLRGSVAGGFAVASIWTGAALGLLYFKFNRLQRGTAIRFSEHGIEFQDATGFYVQLHWPDVTHLGPVLTTMAFGKSMGAIGWGYRTTSPETPEWLLNNFAREPINLADGRPLVAIPIEFIDPNWVHTAMGEWIRRYRPDLFA